MIQLMFEEPNPAAVKAALALMGLMRDELRSPMQSASPHLKEKLSQQLQQLDCL